MSSAHPCPSIAYTQWLQPPNQSFDLLPDGLGYHQQWSYFSRPRNIHTQIMALNNLRNHAWGHHHHPYYLSNAHINSADVASHFSRSETDGFPSTDSVFHPFVFSLRESCLFIYLWYANLCIHSNNMTSNCHIYYLWLIRGICILE